MEQRHEPSLHACAVSGRNAWQVFGRTMVCKDVDVANKVAHRDNLDGVTMEGTQVSKKGVFKGGFHDVSRCESGHSACHTLLVIFCLSHSACHTLLVVL